MPPSIESKRKKERACDGCRKRKTKCDGPFVANNVCTNCLQGRKSCTYLEASKPRGPPKAYITSLEDRLEALESLVQKIRPDVDFSDELGPPVIRDSWKNQLESACVPPFTSTSSQRPSLSSLSALPPILIPQHAQNHTHVSLSSATLSPCSTHLTFNTHSHAERSKKDSPNKLMSYRDSNKFSDDNSSSDYSSSPSDAEDTIVTSLVGRMKMTLKVAEEDSDPEDSGIRFHGRISTAGLVEVARQFKHMHLQGFSEHGSPSSPDNSSVAQNRRPVFWRTAQWESVEDAEATQLPAFLTLFPPIELCRQLVDLYFRHCNTLYPLLHRPTFDRQWSNGLYRRNIWFAAVCMLIFAVGSSWSDDERVLPDAARSEGGNHDWTQSGRHFFEAALDVHWVRRTYLHSSSLFEIQTLPLIGMYLGGTGDLSSAWVYVSLGLRKAQDVGAHRKKVYRDKINVDDELWKRAFWHLVLFDRMGSVYLGRPPCIREEEFDLDYPLEVDDVYWETEDGRFAQPHGVPSLVSAFNQILRLSKISAFASITLYAIDPSVSIRGIKAPNRGEIRKQISQALQLWFDNIPDHLKWRSDFQNSIIAKQSSIIYTFYHMTRILVHRSFIRAPSTKYITDDAAAADCLDAVRECAHIIRHDHAKRNDTLEDPHPGLVVHACAAFLFIVIWSLNLHEKRLQDHGNYDIKPPVALRTEWMMNDIYFFINIIERLQNRWRVFSGLSSELKALLPSSFQSGKLHSDSTPTPINDPTMGYAKRGLNQPLSTLHPSIHESSPVVHSNHPSNNSLASMPSSSSHHERMHHHPADHYTVYGTHLDVGSAVTPPSIPPMGREYKVHNLTSAPAMQQPFPYISNSMRRTSHSSLNQEYATYAQPRISGIRSNIANGPSSENEDPFDTEMNYTPISRHSRQFDHPAAHPGLYSTYPQHMK